MKFIERAKGRDARIDLLRIIACFLVIVNHTNSTIFQAADPSMKTWWVSLSYFFLCKPAVPIFVMISGYTMLQKEDDYKKTTKRFIRILTVIILFSFLYYLDGILRTEGAILDLPGFFHFIAVAPVTNAYWYLYLYAGIILMMPFLQRMASRMEKKDFYVFFLISGLFVSTYPIFVHYFPEWQITDQFQLPLFDGCICLLLFGEYFRRYGSFPLWIDIAGFSGGLAYNVFLTFFEYRRTSDYYLFYDNRVFLPILVEAVCLFSLIMKIKPGGKTGTLISVIGQCTFGIYLLSDLFLEKTTIVYFQLCSTGIHRMIAVVVWEIVIFVMGFAVTFLLRLIPPVRKLL